MSLYLLSIAVRIIMTKAGSWTKAAKMTKAGETVAAKARSSSIAVKLAIPMSSVVAVARGVVAVVGVLVGILVVGVEGGVEAIEEVVSIRDKFETPVAINAVAVGVVGVVAGFCIRDSVEALVAEEDEGAGVMRRSIQPCGRGGSVHTPSGQ